MTAEQRVARTQKQLSVVLFASTILWMGAALLAVLAIELVVGAWSHTAGFVGWNWNIALAIGVLSGCWVLWRGRHVSSKQRVALWMEERHPRLQYALVTASDPLVTVDKRLLESEIDRSNIDTFIRPAVLTPVIYGGVALSVMAGAFAAALTLASGRSDPVVHDALQKMGVSTPIANRLLGLSVRIKPPAYAGRRISNLDDPSSVTALIGSNVTLIGNGTSGGIVARLGDRNLEVNEIGRKWTAQFTVPDGATTISLTDRSYDRVLAIIPVVDRPPAVVLTEPTRDTVWRHVPAGSINFTARATDDVGLSSGHIEYTVTTGSGEIFKSRTNSLSGIGFGNSTSGQLHASLALQKLALTEGAILSVRAVVSDNNTLTGPSTSTSDTRTFRVARADEYDSLAVEAAPPPPTERSLLTQRMLIVSAESLLTKRPTLASKVYVASSGRIGADQADLRKRVYNILYEQDEAGGDGGVEGDDEELDPQLVLNRDLKQAYDAMWDAERSLNIGEINIALPFMKKAASALDRARLANRLYLRGRTPRVVVNIEKVRLTGKDKGQQNTAAGQRPRADTASVQLNRSLDAALAIAASDPTHFIDALTRLRVQSTAGNPAFATSLGEAVDALRAGKDATAALVRARRALLGAPRDGDPSLPWNGAWGRHR
ncbi:MAG: hypothetical protein ABI311_05430 [Gemmatimonadaceae bacterium]